MFYNYSVSYNNCHKLELRYHYVCWFQYIASYYFYQLSLYYKYVSNNYYVMIVFILLFPHALTLADNVNLSDLYKT